MIISIIKNLLFYLIERFLSPFLFVYRSIFNQFIELQLSLYNFYMSAVHDTNGTTNQNPPPAANPSEAIGAVTAQDR